MLQTEAAAARSLLASLDVSPTQPAPGAAAGATDGHAAQLAAAAGAATEPYTGQTLDAQTVHQQLLQLQYQQAQYMHAVGLAQLQGAPLVQVGSSACCTERWLPCYNAR